MKHPVKILLLIAICCLGFQSSYAMPKFTKKCPDCGGSGRVENAFGWPSTCDNCGGDGKVCNWLTIIMFCGRLYGIFSRSVAKKGK